MTEGTNSLAETQSFFFTVADLLLKEYKLKGFFYKLTVILGVQFFYYFY
jgi:hypothetical protein